MSPKFDKRILKPGWAGEPEPSEMEILTKRLVTDQRLAARWGFTPTTRRQTDWAILQVAMWGDPDWKGLNFALTLQRYTVKDGLQLPLF